MTCSSLEVEWCGFFLVFVYIVLFSDTPKSSARLKVMVMISHHSFKALIGLVRADTRRKLCWLALKVSHSKPMLCQLLKRLSGCECDSIREQSYPDEGFKCRVQPWSQFISSNPTISQRVAAEHLHDRLRSSREEELESES